nr:aldo/keto reductase [Clostridia bacterium]
MVYKSFKDKKISLLGFGAMRFPTLEDGEVDMELSERMIDRAIEAGVNYFDTAYPYHRGTSEIVLGKILSKYPRESYYLADKFPGHQVMDSYDPAPIFEDQLRKCGTDYFDFYLLHNVYERSMDVYTSERYGIIDYFLEQKRLGRIKHLGFSTHALASGISEFLDRVGDAMEFCQIQMNYLDYTLQNAKAKYELLTNRGIPVWIMEPVRGGKLAALPPEDEARLRELRPDASVASFAFRWLMSFDNIGVILSGMSDMAQVEDNINTFRTLSPLSSEEREAVSEIAGKMFSSVPCTACRYCVDGCPMGLDIPLLIATCNELRVSKSVNSAMRVEFLPDDKKPTACIGCGACSAICPQSIDIPTVLSELACRMNDIPRWSDISREREAEARLLRDKKTD